MFNIKKIADEIFQAPSQEDLFERALESHDIKFIKNSDNTFTINEDFSVGLRLNIDIIKNRHLSIVFKHVKGDFSINYLGLLSLRGCPERVDGNFHAEANRLSVLKWAPKFVGGYFDCRFNDARFTEEEVRAVCDVKGEIYV